MTRRSYGAPLEQTCERPGLWRIEGHTVRREVRHGRVRWWISRPSDDGAMHVAVVSSLAAARDYIRQEVNR